ncbi:MAG: type II toxin-antitoxin system HicB family antitoxin [Gammaproteobacteria bacterium]|nr:type II toxin-antitoxin system HicB family antitoxin [Gammaproteobacteria bacterium]
MANKEYAGAMAFAAVPVDVDRLSADSERINITLAKWLISAIDARASNRSKFLAECAIKGLSIEGQLNLTLESDTLTSQGKSGN